MQRVARKGPLEAQAQRRLDRRHAAACGIERRDVVVNDGARGVGGDDLAPRAPARVTQRALDGTRDNAHRRRPQRGAINRQPQPFRQDAARMDPPLAHPRPFVAHHQHPSPGDGERPVVAGNAGHLQRARRQLRGKLCRTGAATPCDAPASDRASERGMQSRCGGTDRAAARVAGHAPPAARWRPGRGCAPRPHRTPTPPPSRHRAAHTHGRRRARAPLASAGRERRSEPPTPPPWPAT